MSDLPISVRLAGCRVVVVGGGEIATGRARSLIECGAEVSVIASKPSDELQSLARAGKVDLEVRAYRRGDLGKARLAFAATDDPEVNRSVWDEAGELGLWINVADDPAHCHFIMPSVLRRGDLSVAVSTSGRSPALARRVRQKIARILGPEYSRLLEVLGEARQQVREKVRDPRERMRLQYRLVDSDLPGLVRQGNDLAVARRVAEIVSGEDSLSPGGTGVVYIVGAGPGDPGLITVRGLACVESADVILHDRLIDPQLLEAARPGCQVIDVGKRQGDQGRMQDFIETTMVDRARNGEIVCRLKGGDPFVFGRGGEEARTLTGAGVAYEIVPGVTSATAAPAAAGIPVTHRHVAHSFLVMTGSRAEEATGGEWAGARDLLAGGGTLVCLMGLSRIGRITERLREAGSPASTPAAVISHGTLPDQRVSVGTLDTIAETGKGMSSPGVIVFGQVVEERRRLETLSGSGRPKSRG